MGLETLFFGLGIIVLLKIIYEDFNSRMIDSRSSSVMFGVVMSLYYSIGGVISFFAYSICFIIILMFFENKIKPRLKGIMYLGKGDVSVLLWVLPGLFIINWIVGFFFVGCYLLINVIQTIVVKEKYAGTFSIFIAFVLSWMFNWFLQTIL